MIRKIALSVSFVLIFISVKAQLVVTTGTLTPQQYVEDVLVGSGVQVSNVTFSGDANQIGEFDATGTAPFIGINSGLVIATGSVDVAVGPNNSGSSSSGGGNNGASDPDLNILEGSAGTNDAAVLEFDFIPSGDSVKFNFVFGSEEYPEYVNSINDVFGFFLSGPGLNGPFSNNAENIALVPGTNTEISINTVNSGANAAYYVDNTGNSGAGSIQFDGYTTVIEIKAQVQCNATYHIKIAIADASDTAWDSGVFLEGGSFNSEQVLVDITIPTIDLVNNMPAIIEGCSDAVINFVRPNSEGADTIHFEISGDAENGVDYPFLADSVIFADGEDTASIVISPIVDGPDDYGQDTVAITYTTVNPCGDTLVSEGTFLILDVPNLVVNAPDTAICPSATVDIYAEGLSAVDPYFYQWVNTNGDTVQVDTLSGISTYTNQGLVDDTMYVYVTDNCNLATVSDTVIISVNDDQAAIYTSGDTTVYCAGQQISLEAFPADSISLYDYVWVDENNNPAGTGAIVSVNPAATISYYVTATNVCNGSTDVDTINVIVDYTPVEITTITNDTILECLGVNYDLELYAEVQNGTLPYSFAWTGGGNSSDSLYQVMVNAPANFYLTVTDDCGIQARDTVEVTFAPYTPMDLLVPELDSTCLGEDAEASVRVLTGGVEPFSYNWENGATTQTISYTTGQLGLIELDVDVTDKCQQTQTVTVEIPVKLCEVQPMNVMTPNGDDKNETLYFRYLENFPENHLVVLNRWGNKVYETDNYQNDWKADDLSDGTYFYVLQLNDNAETIHKGTFTIFKK